MNIYNDFEQAPCYGCKDRWTNDETNCHPTCEKWLAYEKRRAKKRKEMADKANQLRSLNMIGRRWK